MMALPQAGLAQLVALPQAALPQAGLAGAAKHMMGWMWRRRGRRHQLSPRKEVEQEEELKIAEGK